MTLRSALLSGVLVVALVAVAAAYAAAPPRVPPSLPPPSAEPTVAAHALPFGRILPERALPPVRLVLDDGTRTELATVTRGHWTIAQLMFAGCTSTCPIQGVIFQRTQAALADTPARFLSITIDPTGDTPEILTSWLASYEAGSNWRAGAPDFVDLGALVDSLEARGNGIDVHGTAAFLIDPDGRLAYVTETMPSPDTLAALVRQAMASRSPDR